MVVADRTADPECAVGLRSEDGGRQYRIFTLRPSISLWGYVFLRDEEKKLASIVPVNGHSKQELQKEGAEEIARIRATLPADYHDVPVRACEIEISSKLVTRIPEVWKLMLLDTRYVIHPQLERDPNSDHVVIADYADAVGSQYHFSMESGIDVLAGTTRNPPGDTKAGMLAGIGNTMMGYCDKQDMKIESKLDQQVAALLDRLHADEKK